MFALTCIMLIAVAFATLSNAFVFTPTKSLSIGLNRQNSQIAMSATPSPQLDEKTREKIQNLVSNNKIILFMKGNKLFPQCGFSNTACRILDAIGAPYETFNILEDNDVRSGMKVFSSWPTFPQLYVNKEFVGGSDIMIELYQNGELAEMIEIAKAS